MRSNVVLCECLPLVWPDPVHRSTCETRSGSDRPLPRGGLRFARMSTAAAPQRDTRRSQSDNTRLYDRVAPFYRTFEPLYLIFPPARRKAVAALKLKPGDVALEIGAGTGRNFGYLVEAVGPSGTVIGVDAS